MSNHEGVIVQAVDLQKSFRIGSDRLDILKGVDLTIHRGEFLGIVGPSGAGKSTLLHLLGALDRPTSGTLIVDSQEISGLPDSRLAAFRNAKIGFIFQFHHLLPEFTALENTMMPALIARRSRDEAEEVGCNLLERVGLGDRLQHRPGELSGGEQQRVAIARALMVAPEILLADEPTGNLDTKNGEAVFELLRELNRERALTVVLVTHNEGLAARTNRTLLMVDGRLAGGA